MDDIYRWTPEGRDVSSVDWNLVADLLEAIIFGPENVDELPSPTPENMGRVVKLSTDGRIYICTPE